MLEEKEKYQKKTENNIDNSTINQTNNNVEKNDQSNDDNIIKENNEEKYINNHNVNEIDKSYHSKTNNLNDMNQISNSICKISIPNNNETIESTCFFMNIMNKKYLIAYNNDIPGKLIKKKNKIEIINNMGEKFTIKLDKNERMIIYIDLFNIKAVEILEKDKINNIKYLEYDNDNMNKYKNKEIYILQHLEGKDHHLAKATIKNIDEKNNEFEHTLNTNYGLFISPVILFENNKIIGIHKNRHKKSDNKKGTFIFNLINEIKNESKKYSYLYNYNKINNVNEINDNNANEFEDNDLFNLNKEDPNLLINENNEKQNINNHNVNEINKSHHSKTINLNVINRISNSICIVSIPTGEKSTKGTCFFMCIKNKKYLITNNHVITRELVKAKTKIKLKNNIGEKFRIILNKNERIIKNIGKPYDITAIEILEKDKINNINYLEYVYDDMNKYINKEICILQHPKGKDLHLASGTINKIEEDIYEFEHTLDTDYGSSGSPVILIENCKVIGIHKKRIRDNDNKKGTFIFKLIDEIIGKSNIAPKLIDLNKINDMNEINDNDDDANKFEGNNLLLLKYNINIENPIILFYEKFFYRCKNNLIIYINGKEYKLTENYINKDVIDISQNQIEIKVKFIEPIENLTRMFYNIRSLESARFINWDTSKSYDISWSFCNCINLTEIFGIDKFKKVIHINNLFSGCTSLISLPKTLYWDTSKVEKLNELFSGCKSLIEIPDISKWNTSNVIDMRKLFNNCISLKAIPDDIKYWDTSKVKNMSFLFHNCEKLEMLPDVSFWNTSQVETLSNMFSDCKSLKIIPDISKWKTYNVKSMNNLFLNCTLVSVLPDISKWNTKNVINMNCMFDYCINAKTKPDISKLNTKKVKNKRFIRPKKKKYDFEDE